jgi:hypothetical protein
MIIYLNGNSPSEGILQSLQWTSHWYLLFKVIEKLGTEFKWNAKTKNI